MDTYAIRMCMFVRAFMLPERKEGGNGMSEENKGFMNREYTRRQFMKLSAKGLTGVALSSSLLALMGVTESQAASGEVKVIATPTHLLVANYAKCTGCQRCELNCSLANEGALHPYMARVRVRESLNFGLEGPTDDYMHGNGSYGDWTYQPETCKQCAAPKCMEICPMEAIYVSEANGARMVDEEKCVGCGACVKACPWGMPRVHPQRVKSTKCINCGACVKGCPTSALTMIPWEDVATAMN